MLDAGGWMLDAGFRERFDLRGSWGEAGEVEAEAADEDFGRCGGRWGEVAGFEFGEDEAVDLVVGPGLIFYGGQSGALRGEVAPVLEGFEFVGPVGASGDPVAEVVDFDGGEAVAALGHGVFFFLGQSDAAEEIGADFEVLGRGGVEAEVAFVFFRAVALEAGALEDGIDVFGEVGACGVKGGCGGQRDEDETKHADV